MSDEAVDCICVTDTHGLHAIASASANLKPILLEKLKDGRIGVLACAMREFTDLYKEEAEELEPYISTKISMTRAIRNGAARIADKLNSGFSRGPYDEHIELYTASTATSKGYRVLTAADQVQEYDGMDCDVVDLETWVDELGE
jgi:hypothetical protein